MIMAVSNICTNLATEAMYKASVKDELTSQKLLSLFSAANSGQAQASVCNIVSIVLPDAASVLRQGCTALAINCIDVFDNKEKQAQLRLVHKMMMSCGWINHMLEEMTKLLQKTASECVARYETEGTRHNSVSGNKRKVKLGSKVSSKSKRASGKKCSGTAKSSFKEDYTVSLGIAWQFKDLLTISETRKTVLGFKSVERAFNALKVISEFSIKECLQCDYVNTCPILTYTSLSLHMSGVNVTPNGRSNHDPSRLSSEQTLLEQTIEHLLHCTEKVYSASRKSCMMSPRSIHAEKNRKLNEDGANNKDRGSSSITEQKRISNMVMLSTSILKFIVDTCTVDSIHERQDRCLSFTRRYIQFIILNLKHHSHGLLEFKEEDMKETFLCLKISFTYAAKLLNLVLTGSTESTPPPTGAHNLAIDIIDLIVSVEEHLGSRYGSLFLSAAKLWLPDLILALGSLQIHKPESISSSSAFVETKFGFSSWLVILAKIEIGELDDSDDRVDLSSKFSTFRKVVETMIELLRSNQSVLDAVGAFLLNGSMVGLTNKDFDSFFGLLNFVCTKLVKHENGEWVDMKLMLDFIQQMYPQIVTMGGAIGIGHEKRLLERARVLIEPIWRSYVNEGLTEPMETGFCDS
ncbi:uncharacterized protein [Rutidosis leptorrhynchoides]|uniref:uncharacterized protein n=1 Tax=Rutidosis leptorrhynchoides TaxID=125765 RepID=UPI003A98E626